MRDKLKNVRLKAGMTQKDVADKIGISLRYYKQIEAGSRTGDFDIWDKLEDLFKTHQRALCELLEIHPDIANNQ